MFAVHAGYALALLGGLRPPVVRSALWISPAGAGDLSGTSPANAGRLSQINSFIARAAALKADVLLLADQGTYAQNGNIGITNGGVPGQRVMIRGVDGAGADMAAVINGSRANPWSRGAAHGAEVFRLRPGADHLGFAFLRFTNQGYGCIRSNAPHTDLLIEDCSFANVRAFYENGSSGTGVDATVSGLTIRRVTGAGWSKHFARFRYASHDILVEDCHGDAEEQDGDNFCNGIVGEGSESVGLAPDGEANGVHSVIIRRCSMGNCRDTLNAYQNGDAFGNEGQDYDWHFEDCWGWGCSDGGYDCKSRNTTFLRCRSTDNKRGWRIWGDAVATDCISESPKKRGGTGGACHISTFHRGYLRWYGGSMSQTDQVTMIKAEDGGFTAYTPRTAITAPSGTLRELAEANSVVTTIDEADHTPPVYQGSSFTVRSLSGSTTYQVPPGSTVEVNENRIFAATITADKPVTTRIARSADSAQFTSEGQRWTMKRQDYENDRSIGQDQTYRAPLRLWDANGNHSDWPLAQRILNIDDNPVGAGDLLADGVTDGAWWEVQDLGTLFTDRAGTVPVAAWADDGDPIVRRVRDKLGFGNDLVVPDDGMGFYLRHDDALGLYWLEPFIAGSFFQIGAPGALRFAKLTSSLGISREPSETAAAVLISVPRSLTIPSASNAVWWQLVQGGQSYGIRLPGSGNTATTTGNAATPATPLMLTLQSEPGIGRSNASDVLDVADVEAVTYPTGSASTATGRARLLADGNGAQIFNGRFYGGVVTNRTEADTMRFRIERQIAEWMGLTL